MEKACGAKTKIGPGKAGSFEVTVDGKLVYSKLKTGKYPTNEEIIELLKK